MAVAFGFVVGEAAVHVSGRQDLQPYLSAVVALAFFLTLAVSLFRFLRRQRERVSQDLSGAVIEVLEVESQRAVELPPDHSSVDPTVIIDIGQNELLILAGQWLREPSVFGAPDSALVADEPPWLNGLAPPFAFPSTRFELERWPQSGEVISIDICGEYLEPEQTTSETQLKELNPLPSQLISGSLEALEDALKQAAERASA